MKWPERIGEFRRLHTEHGVSMDRSDPYYDSLVSYAIPSRPGKRYSRYSPDDLGPPGTNAASIEIHHLDLADRWMMEVSVNVVKRMGDVPEAYDAHGEFIVWKYAEVFKTRADVVRGIPKTYKAVLAKAKKYDGDLLRTARKNPRRRRNSGWTAADEKRLFDLEVKVGESKYGGSFGLPKPPKRGEIDPEIEIEKLKKKRAAATEKERRAAEKAVWPSGGRPYLLFTNRLPGAPGSPPFYRDFRGQTFELYLWEPAERKRFLEKWEDDLDQRGHRVHLVRSGSDWALYWKRAEGTRWVAANPRRRR